MAQALLRRGWNRLYLDELNHIPTHPIPLMSEVTAIKVLQLTFYSEEWRELEKTCSYAAFYDLLSRIIFDIIGSLLVE